MRRIDASTSHSHDEPGTHRVLDVLARLHPRSIIVILVLVLLSGGVYIPIWYHRVARALRRIGVPRTLPRGAVALTYALFAAYIAWRLEGERFVGDLLSHPGYLPVVTKAFNICVLAWTGWVATRLARALNRTDDADGGPWLRIGWAATLQFLYLQWKINRRLSERRALKAGDRVNSQGL